MSGIILYPTKYDVDESIIYGVHHKTGENIKCKLVVAQDDENNPSVKKLIAVNRKKVKDKNCLESETNSKENPEGMILLEQVEKLEDGTYKAGWLSVLRTCDLDPMPPMGIGFLEIRKKFNPSESSAILMDEIEELKADFKEGDFETQNKIFSNISKILQEETKLMATVIVDYAKTYRVPMERINDKNLFEVPLKRALEATSNGVYGGALIRVTKGKTVLPESTMIRSEYDTKKGDVEDTTVTLNRFMQYKSGKVLRKAKEDGVVVDIIPFKAYNLPPDSKKRYIYDPKIGIASWTSGAPKMLKTYVEGKFQELPLTDYYKDCAYLASPVVVRPYEHSNGSIMTSALHSAGKALGNIYELSPDLKREYYMWYKDKNQA